MKKISLTFIILILSGCISQDERDKRLIFAKNHADKFLLSAKNKHDTEERYSKLIAITKSIECKENCDIYFERATEFLIKNASYPLNSALGSYIQSGSQAINISIIKKTEKYLDAKNSSENLIDTMSCGLLSGRARDNCLNKAEETRDSLVSRERNIYILGEDAWKISGHAHFLKTGKSRKLSVVFTCQIPKQSDYITVAYQSENAWINFTQFGAFPDHKSGIDKLIKFFYADGVVDAEKRDFIQHQIAFHEKSAACIKKAADGLSYVMYGSEKNESFSAAESFEAELASTELDYERSLQGISLDSALFGISNNQNDRAYKSNFNVAKGFIFKRYGFSGLIEIPVSGIATKGFFYKISSVVNGKDMIFLPSPGAGVVRILINKDGSANSVSMDGGTLMDSGDVVYAPGTFSMKQ